MAHRKRRRPARTDRTVRRPSGPLIEPVESRTLMSTSASPVLRPDVVYDRPAAATVSAADTTYTAADGYTPAQIRAAYGFDGLTFGSGVTADGTGQTIAIVDAYNDPNIRTDLAAFDAQFGIPAPPGFAIVSQGGTDNLPATDAGWAGEISLDVEWAHAIAPGANILLVEATTDSTDDLVAGVNYARAAAGVSVVSMSWGGSETESWGNGGESASQTTLDPDFTTPAGHQGVTFVAAAGDTGQQAGVQWPASSPNVVSVGGTSLVLNADDSIASETGWSGTSSGASQVEAEPTYQDAVNSTGTREVADVAYDADPDDGFAVYDSLADDGYSGWQEVGGTSAGAPQWSALIAVADQGRVSAGATTLNGVNQTLPDLYALYSAYGTTGYASYTTDFNDVTTGGAGDVPSPRGGRGGFGGGQQDNTAAVGYDVVTGLGTPRAAALVADLATTAADTGTGSGTTTAGSGGTTTATEATSPVAVTILTTPKSSVIGGQAGTLQVKLTNTGGTTFGGPVTVDVYASADTVLSTTGDPLLVEKILSAVKLKAGASRVVTLDFKYPSTGLATGDYYLLAEANATQTETAATTAYTPAAVTINAPSADLSVSFAGATAVAVTAGKRAKATVRLTNLGNVTATGSVVVDLYAGDLLVATVTRKVKVAAGKATTFAMPFTFPIGLSAGDTTLTAVISPTTTPTDTDTGDTTATAPTVAA